MFEPRRLALRVALTTAIAWTLGVAGLTGFALLSSRQAGEAQRDLELQMQAWAVYGLAWFDTDGAFHPETLLRETQLLDGGDAVRIHTGAALVFSHGTAEAALPDLAPLAREVVATDAPAWRSGADESGHAYRLFALPTYDDADRPVAAIVIAADAGPTERAWRAFTVRLLAVSAALVVVGILLSGLLAERLLRPLQQTLRERQQFIAAAAHELRTPVATLLALIESARAGDEPAEQALERIHETATRTAGLVDRLLTLSRGAEVPLQLEPVRLDLLVESLLHDDEPCTAEPVVVTGDTRLLEVAIGNLLENARTHGGGVVGVEVVAGTVRIRDAGPGLDGLENPTAAFVRGPQSRGSGLGLALVDRIARAHDGQLVLGPGPVVRFALPT